MKSSTQPVEPVRDSLLAAAERARPTVDFSDTARSFAHRTDDELARARRLFAFMNHPLAVRIGSAIGTRAVRWGLPFAERITLETIYRLFVGGRTLLEVQDATQRLGDLGVFSILDYGAEGKEGEQAYNLTMTECIRALDFAALNAHVPVVATKISGLASGELLDAMSTGRPLSLEFEAERAALVKRVDSLCHVAAHRDVQLYFDAEESWYQPAIDDLVLGAMRRYNTKRAIVFGTYQLYRHDRLAALREHHEACRAAGVRLGAKLVRGAYMVKERARAEDLGYASPIQPDKASTDRDFDAAVAYCLEHLADLEFCNASHNQASATRMIEGMHERQIPRDHPHVAFCQLYGMSDNMTFALASAGYRVGKYVTYGPVADVVPYLVRRAQENTSVTGEASRELQLLEREIARRRQTRP